MQEVMTLDSGLASIRMLKKYSTYGSFCRMLVIGEFMYKYVFGIVAGMVIVPWIYLAEAGRGMGFVFSAMPILLAFLVVVGTWYFSFRVLKDEPDMNACL
jgi:hypothetical protein